MGGGHCQRRRAPLLAVPKRREGMSDTNAAILTQLAAPSPPCKDHGSSWGLEHDAQDIDGVQLDEHCQWKHSCTGVAHMQRPHIRFLRGLEKFEQCSGWSQAAVDGGCNPHWTVRLYLHGAARAKAIRRLVKPDAIPGILPYGPLNKPMPGDDQCCMGGFKEWYKKARAVWHSLMSTEPKIATHKFRWGVGNGENRVS